MTEVRRMRITEIDEFPAIKAAVNNGIAAGIHKLHTETDDPTYHEAQEYVIGYIKAALDTLIAKPSPSRDEMLERYNVEITPNVQGPKAWMHIFSDGHTHCVTKDESGFVDNLTGTYKTVPLYTAPPKREWVGLTDEEIGWIWHNSPPNSHEYARAIEAKLKEKNA